VVPYKGIGLRYSASMNPSLKDDKEKLLPFDQLFLQHSAGLSLTTDADCWHLDLSLTYVPSSDRFVFGFLLDLKNLGSFGRTQGNF
jgi:hypothetical protein